MEQARTLAPDIDTAAITPPLEPAPLEALSARADAHGIGAISLHAAAAGPEAVDSAHRHGLRLFAWTADTPEDWRRLSEAGVDGIITNQPAALRAWNESRGPA